METAGADAVLDKALGPEDLAAAADAALERKRLVRRRVRVASRRLMDGRRRRRRSCRRAEASPSPALTASVADAAGHSPQDQRFPHMVSTGSQAAPAQAPATGAAVRQPPVAATARSSGSPSSSTTTGVAAEVSTQV